MRLYYAVKSGCKCSEAAQSSPAPCQSPRMFAKKIVNPHISINTSVLAKMCPLIRNFCGINFHEFVRKLSFIVNINYVVSICDRICKKGSYTRNYKYLEIPVIMLSYSITILLKCHKGITTYNTGYNNRKMVANKDT